LDAKVTWKNGLAFDGNADSGFALNLDAAVAHGGQDSGLRPLELILIGLAGCTAMDVISILQKKRQDVTGFEVRAHAERADDHPRVFTSVVIEYVVCGNNIDRAAVERAVELSETKYCSAQAMLVKAVPIEHRIIIETAAG
jgi:putative redox protein